eukprot:g22304.t1
MSEPNNGPQPQPQPPSKKNTSKRGLQTAANAGPTKPSKQPCLQQPPSSLFLCNDKGHGFCEGHFWSRCFPSDGPNPQGYPYRLLEGTRKADDCEDEHIDESKHFVSAWFDNHKSSQQGQKNRNGPWLLDLAENFERHLERLQAAPEGHRQWATVILESRPIGLKLDIDGQPGNEPELAAADDSKSKRERAESWFKVLVTAVNALLRERGERQQQHYPPLAECDFLVVADLHKPGGLLSLHVHSDYLRFNALAELKGFVEELRKSLEVKLSKLAAAVDLAVYKRRGLLKLPFQNKPGRQPMLPLAGLGAQLSTRDALLWGLAHKPHEYWPAQVRVLLPAVQPASARRGSCSKKNILTANTDGNGGDGKEWFCRELVGNFLRERRHHNPNLVFNLTNRNNQQKSLYIEYVKNSTGSRQHPCPAYDGCTHDSNNAYIRACDEFMHVSVLCLAEACRRRGPAIFELGDCKEGQGGSQRLDSGGTEGSKEGESQGIDDVQEREEGEKDGDEEEDEEEEDDEALERNGRKYRARLEGLLSQLTPLARPAKLDYVGQDLPYGRLEEACQKRKRTVSKAVKLFMKYWQGEAAAKRRFKPLQKKADDSGEDSKENSEEDSEEENSWEDTFVERYEDAREELTQRLTLFMNDYLCQISGTSKEAVAVFWGLGAEREWILKPINDFKHQGDDLKTELPPLLIKAKTKGRKETRGSVRPDRGLKTTFRRAWLQNTKRRVAKGIDFYTDPTQEAVHNKRYSECLTNKLNWFTGFRVSTQQVQKYMQTHGLDAAEMDRLASPFRDYVHDIIAGGVTQMYLYLLKWLYSLLLQGQKPEQACVFISEPGAGKSTLVELLARVIGEQWVFVSSKPDELTGKHNLHLGFKVLVVSEEAVHSTNKVGSNAMKEKITSKRLNINPKFMPLFSVRDPSGLFFNSNHDDTVLVERGDRRYIFFPVSNKFANRIRTTSAQEYFARLHALPDEVLAWQVFCSQDPRVDKVDLRRDARYDTEIFWNSAYASSPLHVQFLYYTVKNNNFLDEVEGLCTGRPRTGTNITTSGARSTEMAKRLLAGVSQEEQVQHVRAQITGVYNARYS